MKQTAVEWLEEQIICQQNIYIDMAKKNKLLKKQVDAILTATTLLKMKCKQAKEMEKEQQDEFAIEFAEWSVCRAMGLDSFKLNDNELEIYKKEKGL